MLKFNRPDEIPKKKKRNGDYLRGPEKYQTMKIIEYLNLRSINSDSLNTDFIFI